MCFLLVSKTHACFENNVEPQLSPKEQILKEMLKIRQNPNFDFKIH